MRRVFLLLACILSFPILAQGVWEVPDADKPKEVIDGDKKGKIIPQEDVKYLEGAVPEKDGRVLWSHDYDIPGKSAKQIYDIMFKFLSDFTKADNQLEGSGVSLVNKNEHIIIATVKEWLVFKENFLMLDRTKFNYNIIAYCGDGKLTVVITRIYYRYEEERVKGGYLYKAEDWINDKNALNRSKTKLIRGSAKFRKKTIDRKDEIFESIAQLFQV